MSMTAEIIIAILGLLGLTITSYFSYRAQTHSKAANDAVNNRHTDSPKIYDLVVKHAEGMARVEMGIEKNSNDIESLRGDVDKIATESRDRCAAVIIQNKKCDDQQSDPE